MPKLSAQKSASKKNFSNKERQGAIVHTMQEVCRRIICKYFAHDLGSHGIKPLLQRLPLKRFYTHRKKAALKNSRGEKFFLQGG